MPITILIKKDGKYQRRISNYQNDRLMNNQKQIITLTVSQVASRLGKSGETIKRWLRSGKHSLTLLRTAMYRDGVSLKMT
ncbi:hypothetical protein FOA20_16535 [Peribacillus simplex]